MSGGPAPVRSARASSTATGLAAVSPPAVGASRLVAALVGAVVMACALGVAAPAALAADRSVAVIVVPPFAPSAYADRGAVGLLVPGAGSTVSRERALASLVRGRVVSSLVDLDGTPAIQLCEPPGHHHDLRLPAAGRVASQRHALSRRDRRAGVPRAAHVGLDAHRRARLARRHRADREGDRRRQRRRRSDRAADNDAAATLARLDVRLARAHDARTGATLVLVGWLVAFAALGILAPLGPWRAVPPCSSLRWRSATALAPPRGRHRATRRS